MIIGVDECNFSPSLAGDCIVCSLVALNKVDGVQDSKTLSRRRQIELFAEIHKSSIYSVVPATVNAIEQEGVYKSRNRAIVASLSTLVSQLQESGKIDESTEVEIQVDGKWSRRVLQKMSTSASCLPVTGIVHGDRLVYEISAASIVARVYANALFEGWNSFFPGYYLNGNHGSPDEKMYRKIREAGPCPIHRVHYGKSWWDRIMKGDLGGA